MKIYIFLYNIIKIKSDFKNLFNPKTDRFILVANEACLENLSPENKALFEEIISLKEFSYANVEKSLQKYLQQGSRENLKILTNEESCAVLCGQLREKYQLAGASAATLLPFVDKVAMKKALDAGNIRRPKYIHFDPITYQQNPAQYLNNIEQQIGYPMIAKPIDSYGSIDTLKILTRADLENYIKENINTANNFEIDEYIDGELYHCDGLVKDNHILIFLACRYNTPCVYFTHGSPLGSLLLEQQNLMQTRLYHFTEAILHTLQLPDGAFHLEVFVNKKQELIFLEVGARTPGALVMPAYEKMFGINLEEQHYRLQMSLPHTPHLPPPKLYCAWMMFPTYYGCVEKLNEPQIDSQYQIDYYVKLNQQTHDPESLLDVATTLLLFNASYSALQNDFVTLQSFQPITYQQKP